MRRAGLTEVFLRQRYEVEERSIDEIAIEVGLCRETVRKALHSFGIKVLTRHEGKVRLMKRATRDLLLSSVQREFLIATMMGDAGMVSTNHGAGVNFCHGEKQKDYLLKKIEMMEPFPHGFVDKDKDDCFRVYFHSHTEFEPIRQDFYSGPNGEKVIRACHVFSLGFLGLAIWFADDGTIIRSVKQSDMAVFCLSPKYTTEEQEICAILNQWFGGVNLRGGGEYVWKFSFTVEATQRLAEEVNGYLTSFLPAKVILPRLLKRN